MFEVLFDTEEQWEAFRGLPVVRAALDAAPDPVNGLLIYRGRGGHRVGHDWSVTAASHSRPPSSVSSSTMIFSSAMRNLWALKSMR